VGKHIQNIKQQRWEILCACNRNHLDTAQHMFIATKRVEENILHKISSFKSKSYPCSTSNSYILLAKLKDYANVEKAANIEG
jgi:formyltetrahydrofolate synthetase